MKIKYEQWEKLHLLVYNYYKNMEEPIGYLFSDAARDLLVLDAIKKATEAAKSDPDGVDPSNIEIKSVPLLAYVIAQYAIYEDKRFRFKSEINAEVYLNIIKQLLEMKPDPNKLFKVKDILDDRMPPSGLYHKYYQITPLALVMTLLDKEACLFIAENLLAIGGDFYLGDISPVLVAALSFSENVSEKKWKLEFLREKHVDISKKYNYLSYNKDMCEGGEKTCISALEAYMDYMQTVENNHKTVEALLGNPRIASTEEINFIKNLCEKDALVSIHCLRHYVLMANARRSLEADKTFMKRHEEKLCNDYISQLQLLEQAKRELHSSDGISFDLQKRLEENTIVYTLLKVENELCTISQMTSSNELQKIKSLNGKIEKLLFQLFSLAKVPPLVPIVVSKMRDVLKELEISKIENEAKARLDPDYQAKIPKMCDVRYQGKMTKDEKNSRDLIILKFSNYALLYSIRNTNLQPGDIKLKQIESDISTSLQKELDDLYKTYPMKVLETTQCMEKEVKAFAYYLTKHEHGSKYKLPPDSLIAKLAKKLKGEDLIHKSSWSARNIVKWILKKVFAYSIQADAVIKSPSQKQLTNLNKVVTWTRE